MIKRDGFSRRAAACRRTRRRLGGIPAVRDAAGPSAGFQTPGSRKRGSSARAASAERWSSRAKPAPKRESGWL